MSTDIQIPELNEQSLPGKSARIDAREKTLN